MVNLTNEIIWLKKELERVKKDLDLANDEIQLLNLENKRLNEIEQSHKKLNGELHEQIEQVKKEADKLMMNKIIKYEKEIKVLKDRVNNAETETALIKATGMNSPEMIAVKKEVYELRQDNRRLSKQVEDGVDRMRKAVVI